MRSFRGLLILALCGIGGSAVLAAPEGIASAEQLMVDRQFAKAADVLKPLADAGGEGADYALFLLGRARFEEGKYEDALAAYEGVVTKFPNSPWKKKALYRKADCLIRLKQFDKAGDLLQPQMEGLVSDARMEEIAGAYLKYADQYFAPKEKDKKPDYGKARSLYQKALELGLTPKTKARVQFLVARCDFESGRFSEAAQGLEVFLKESPDAEQAPEAKLFLGRCYVNMERGPAARRVFRDFLNDYPKSDLRSQVSFGIALSYHVPNARSDKELELGVKALADFCEKFPKAEDALKAAYWIPLSYFSRNRFDEAEKGFTQFLREHRRGDAEYLAPAQEMLGQIAFRQKRYEAAIDAWREFLKRYPNHSLWPSVQRRVLDTEYLRGQEAYEQKKYRDAERLWKRFQEDYPLDLRNPDLMFMLGQMEFDQKRYKEAVEKWQQLASKYENTDAAARALLMVGVTQEEKLEDFDKAAETYAKVKQGRWATEAAQRLQTLKEKKLVVYTERTFTSADKPVLKLLTRNVEKVEFRGYRVNLGDYFRKFHSIRGVDTLDLALIDPDEKWELSLPGYKEKKQMETEASLPFKEPGVYAVVCEARETEPTQQANVLQATTIVMITDLALTAKATRRDVLVFAENMKERKPFAEAEVLLSDGAKVLGTGRTDRDGVFQTELDTLKDVAQLRVLAFSGTHYASTENPLQGLRYVAALSPKALIYSDRPLYRPGQGVHLRGIVRKVEKGAYTFTKGDKFDVQVLSPAGIAVLKRTVELNEFGTFASSLTLPPEAQTGNYRVVATQDKLSFSGGFEVGEYELPKIRMDIKLPRAAYLRGEKIEGKVAVSFYYGEPLVGRKVRVGWAEAPDKEMATNARGEVEFSIDTKQFEEEQVVAIHASLPDEGISAAANVYVALVELSASVSTLRDLYLVGEKFEVFAQAKDLSGKPVETKFTLHILKREQTEGGLWGEREVDKAKLTTNAKDGKGSISVAPNKSGSYILRLKGEDRNGNPVTAERYVTVVGEEDKVKLRLLTDTDTFKVGDTAPIRVVSRADKNLALVTYEGEVIYGHQLVTLNKGENTIQVPMAPKLSPGFVLSVSMMDGDEFYATAKTLKVQGALQVTLKPDKEKYRPGDEVKLAVSAADPQGKPAKAELSLAAVDASLFAVRADRTPSLSDYFYQRPISADTVLTQTSCTFNYSAQAKLTAIQIREAQDVTTRMRREVSLASPLPVIGELFEGRRETVPFDHWAYDAFSKLAEQGVLEGIPDGTFKGERALSRYEMAVAIARAKEKGMATEDLDRLSTEFGTELAALGRRMDKREESRERLASPAGAKGDMGPAGAAGERPEAKPIAAAPPRVPGKPGAPPPPPPLREFFAETAFWKADVVTDEKGEATVSFKLPDSITEWRLTARGVTVATLAGDATEKATTHKDFVAELKLPEVFQQGDTVEVTVLAHNNTDNPTKAVVSLAMKVDGRGEEQRKEVTLAAHDVSEVAFPFTVPEGQTVNAEVRLGQDNEALDAERQTVPIRPWGVEYVDSAGGVATGDAFAELKLPTLKYATKRMTVTVGPSVESSLIEAVEAPPPIVRCGLVADLSSRGKELTAMVAYLRAVKRSETPEYQRLAARLETEIARLLATQREDGGWSWAEVSKDSDVFVSAEGVTTLAEAKALGFDVSAEKLAKATAYLQGAFHRVEESDNERKAAVLYAQARAGEADFGALNRLFRLRTSLDTRTMALVMLALCEMDRAAMAAELVPVLKERLVKEEAGRMPALHFGEAKVTFRWGGDAVETTALALNALVRADPKSELIPDLARWLWAQRRGSGWPTATANTAAVRALAAYSQAMQAVTNQFTLTVKVNGKEVKQVKVEGAATTAAVDVPRDLLDADTVRVDFSFAGRGQYTYSCLLTGFSDQVDRKTQDLFVERKYLHPPVTFEGKRLQSGFSTVEIKETWDNPASEVTTGHQVIVNANWHTERNFRPGGYVVVREPLPLGCGVVDGTVRGSFERFEKLPGSLVLFFRTDNREWANGQYQYELFGSLPGTYRSLPPQVWAYYQPDHYAFGEVASLKVLPRDRETSDKYRLTPDELYALGTALYEAKRYEEADKHLTDFFDNYKVREEPAKATAQRLFDIALKRGDAKRTVRFFEVLRERFPDHVVPFADIVRVAKAYREVGEPERQVQVCRAVAESSFDTESRVAGVLNEQGEFEAAVGFVRDLALGYPDVAPAERSFYSLSQFIYGKADKLDEAMKQAGMTKEKMIERAIEQMRRFLTLYPTSPLVEEATFSLLNAFMDLQQYDKAAALAAEAQARYPQSAYLDDYQYIRALASFLGQHFEEALALCRELATKDYPRPDGGVGPSDYKALALYISAQVFHSEGKPTEALKYYSEVAGKFPDARNSIDYFQHAGLRLPEVTVAPRKAPAEVKLTYRNLKQAQVKVFRVDLLKFYQVHRSLSNVSRMNLAGIKPTFEQAVDLPAGGEMQDKEFVLKLPLDQPGAYFIVATPLGSEKGDAVASSGVLLRTDLKVEVQEYPTSGQVRVNVLDTTTGQYVPKAEVWVIGSETPEFRKGQSDLRGVMVAEDLRGKATVIAAKDVPAQAGKQYAFYRGDAVLQPQRAEEEKARRKQAAPGKPTEFKDEATLKLREMNEANRAQRAGEFEKQLKGGAFGGFGGVQVQQAF